MTSRILLMTAAVLALMPVAGCTTPATKGAAPVDLTFSTMAPLPLHVGQVQVTTMPQLPNDTSSKLQQLPQASLERYARQRLQATGSDGTLEFVIQQATLRSQDDTGSGKWTEAFQLSKPIEYTVTMKVGLNLANRSGQPDVKSAYTLERKKTLAEGASLADRDRAIAQLVSDMVVDMDKSVQKGLSDNMHILSALPVITAPQSPRVIPLTAAGQD